MSDYYSRNISLATPTAQGQTAALNKAQQFEDEKRRVMQSCFSKLDTDGSQVLESYITHCRVTEDGASSEPPAAGAPQDHRKVRVIMVAVRKSGRVRMHKARENPNGSFSIGKTWNLDDLQSITNYPPPNERGFTVTILKPYYWQANSAKEKDFFISSLVKIYKKYTGGNVPELLGFKQLELESLVGPSGAQAAPRARPEELSRQAPPKTPTSSAFSESSSASNPPPTPRNTSGAQPMDPLNKPSSGSSSQRSADGKSLDPGPGLPPQGSIRPAKSPGGLSERRVLPKGTPQRHPSPPLMGVQPMPQGGSAPSNGRRPSDGSSTRSGGGRAPSNPRVPQWPEEDRAMRRVASQEKFRSPSVNSQQSQNSGREAMDHPYPHKLNDSMPMPKPQDSQGPLNKKSNRDIASQFRLAANAYGLENKLRSPNSRPRTPTTPTHTSSLFKEPLNLPFPGDPPAMPKINYPPPRPSGDTAINGSVYRQRPSEDGGRSRSVSTSSKDLQPVVSNGPPPLTPKEPPPKHDIRGRPPPSRENSRSKAPPPSASKAQPPISESALLIKKPQTPVPTAVVSPPPPEEAVQGSHQLPYQDDASLQAPQASRNRSRSPGARSWKRRSTRASRYLDGFDRSQLSLDIDDMLEEFNWDRTGKIDLLQADVKKELSRVESRNVVVSVDGDQRIEYLSELLDRAIQECEDMDGLLTLYAVELSSLNDDVTHIENQSQGLQLQTANQKTLQKELQNLLDTISISPSQIDILKHGSLESPQGLEQVEQTLVSLYKAIKTIEPGSTVDPSSPRVPGRRGSFSDSGVGSMRAVQERKDEYRASCRAFLGRLRQFLNIKFQAELMEIRKDGNAAQVNAGLRPRMVGHDKAYQALWKFAGLIAFARDVDGDEYVELRKLYETPAKQIIQDEIRDHVGAWKKITKTLTPEEQEALVFTTPEKEELVSSSLSAARKLTVKKSIARIRTGGGSFAGGERPSPGIIDANEAFAGAFGEIYQLVYKEQNFIVEFFHLSSRNASDFAEFISNGTPETRRVGDLGGMRAVEPDKLKAKLIYEFMGQVFSFLMQELQSMVEWATSGDATQGVGIMYAVEQKMATLDETDQEFLAKTMQKLHDRLTGLFARFLDEQLKAIEETKVKIKKRKGVIGFMRVFPGFSAKIEEQIPYDRPSPPSGELDIREMVNEGYAKINKAMFESLQAIAKDSPQVASQNVDPEDKEQLNYHIMMIENMHHYLAEVDTKGNDILEDFRKKAEEEYKEHMGLYIGAVIRRPLAKLLDFVENVEALQKTGTEDFVGRSSHNKAAFKKVLDHNEGKDIRKGIEQLKKRVDKHFGEGDDAVLSQKLVEKILTRLEDEYINLHKRIMLLLVGPYKDTGLECSFMVNDVKVAFKR